MWGSAVAEAVDACGVAVIYQSDVLLDAQDHELTALEVTAAVDGDEATATARFQNLGKPTEIRLALVREDGVWRIDDVLPPGKTLRERIFSTIVDGDGC
jgi:hypothetical protein